MPGKESKRRPLQGGRLRFTPRFTAAGCALSASSFAPKRSVAASFSAANASILWITMNHDPAN
jgi:hypothetical protein